MNEAQAIIDQMKELIDVSQNKTKGNLVREMSTIK